MAKILRGAVPSVRAFLPSRVESFNAGRAGAQPYRVTTASAECGKVRQIVIRPRFLNDVSTPSLRS